MSERLTAICPHCRGIAGDHYRFCVSHPQPKEAPESELAVLRGIVEQTVELRRAWHSDTRLLSHTSLKKAFWDRIDALIEERDRSCVEGLKKAGAL